MDPAKNAPDTSWVAQMRAMLRRYRLVLRRFWWIPALTIGVGVLTAGVLTVRQPVVHLSTARMMVSGKIALQEGAMYAEEAGNFLGTQMELMRSGEVRRRAVARLRVLHPELPPDPVTVTVSVLPKTAIFILQATGRTPDYTRLFLDACLDEYIAIKKEMRAEKSETTQTAITDELARLEKEIRAGEEDLLNFQKQNNVGFLQEEGNSAGAYLSKLNRQLADLKTEHQLLEKLDLDQNIERVRAPATEKANGETVPTIAGPEAEYLRARQQIALLKAQREDFARELRPKHPIMMDLEAQIAQQEKLVETFRQNSLEQLKTRRESLALQIRNLESVIQEWELRALRLSERLAEYNRLKSKVDRAKAAHDRLLASLHNVDFTRNVDQDVVSILERASPAVPLRLNVWRNLLLGILCGLCAGMGILFVIEQADDRISCGPDYTLSFDAPLLACVPCERLVDGQVPPLAHDDPRHGFAESLRALRSAIFFREFKGPPPKGFLVTSAVPNEGKSTIALNLAITMAFSGVRVLLVDGDLRRGALHALCQVPNRSGFSEVLRGEAEIDAACVATSTPGLLLLPRGASIAHPGELFLSQKADEVLRTLYARFDYVVFDSCPVLAADDTTSLSPKIDATLFVVRHGFSSARASRKALALLGERQANVLGLVCNDVAATAHEAYYYRYPDYYSGKVPA